MTGFLTPIIICAGLLGLHVLLPARRVTGYVTDPATGRPYEYRLNGLLVLAVATGGGLIAGGTGWLPWGWLHRHAWWGAAGATALGALVTLWLVFAPPHRAVARSHSPGLRGWIRDFYLGRVGNLAFAGRVDTKMFLYVFGAVLLALNACSYAAHHADLYGSEANPGVYLHAALLGWFVVDYLVFERVHLYTYDIFAERLGAKIVWGCLAFYPYFYAIGLWGTARLPKPGLVERAGPWWLAACAVLFGAGWVLSRGANLQKYRFKRFPDRSFGGIQPRAVADDRARLLASGFWGVSRHVNYLGEILISLGLALAPGHFTSVWPWLYPAFMIAFMLIRERADERRCAAKYGPLWERYCERVPYRIIPRLY